MPRLLLTLLLPLCASALAAAEVRELRWAEMIPAGAEVPANLGQPQHNSGGPIVESGPAAAQQSPDAPVVTELDGQQVKLPGYIVPVQVGDDGTVTQFLLVPFFGACIHVPPPPANQIVLVQFDKGVLLDVLYQPFWIEGELSTLAVSSEIANAGYSMQANKVYPYE